MKVQDPCLMADQPTSWTVRVARQLVIKSLSRLKNIQICVHDQDGTWLLGDPGAEVEQRFVVQLKEARLWRELLLGGSLAVGEGYVQGHWRCEDLLGLLRALAAQMEALQQGLDHPLKRWLLPMQRLAHWVNRNTKTGSRRNIQAHYDLGNDFFRLFLDQQHKMYSSAIYPHPEADLETASTYKLEMIARKLDLQPEDHLLEIGTGWGGMAIYAAQHYGCKVTTTTISREQYLHAQQKIAAAGLEDRIELLFEDYRDLTGQYDKLVSIEMIEAVGHDFLPVYLKTLAARLKPEGLALIQAITIRDQRYDQGVKRMDFIKKFIFPGGFLPSLTELSRQLTRHTPLNVINLDEIGLHYAQTLADWRERFHAQLDQVRALGYDEHFIRMWTYYLVYCEAGFRERSIGTAQLLLAGPQNRAAAWNGGALMR